MTMRRRLLSLLLLLALVLSLGICSAAAEEDFTIESKALYGNDPLYIDLNLNAKTSPMMPISSSCVKAPSFFTRMPA